MAATTATTIAAITAAVASTAGAVMQGVSNYQQGKVAEAQSKINAAQDLQAEKQAFQEESLNASQHYRMTRHEIASGLNMMLASGNVGASTEAALRGGYFNLSEDLSALRYKYGAEAAGHKTSALNNYYNARIQKKNRRIGVLASGINVTGAAAKGVMGIYSAGALTSKAPGNTYKGAVTNDGMYGAWAG